MLYGAQYIFVNTNIFCCDFLSANSCFHASLNCCKQKAIVQSIIQGDFLWHFLWFICNHWKRLIQFQRLLEHTQRIKADFHISFYSHFFLVEYTDFSNSLSPSRPLSVINNFFRQSDSLQYASNAQSKFFLVQKIL